MSRAVPRWALLVALVAASARAWAQPEPADAPVPADEPAAPAEPTRSAEEEAAASFEQGQRAFEEDDYAAALTAFEQAQRLAPSDVVRFNIGLCLERLARFREALAEYQHAAASTELDEPSRVGAQERAQRVQARVGTIVVPGPAGVNVEVVGVETCTAPCRVTVDPGTYTVRRTDREGLSPAVAVSRGEERVAALEVVAPTDPPDDEPSAGLRLGLIGWIGAGVAAVGTVATIMLGVQATALHEDFLDHPNRDDMNAGRAAVIGTDVALVFAILGAATVVVDLFVLERRAPTPDREPARLSLAF